MRNGSLYVPHHNASYLLVLFKTNIYSMKKKIVIGANYRLERVPFFRFNGNMASVVSFTRACTIRASSPQRTHCWKTIDAFCVGILPV